MAGDLILPPAPGRLRANPTAGRSPDDIMHRKALQGEDDRCQAGPPDLWHGVLRHALLPELPAVQSKAFPRRRPASPASSLLGFTPAQKKNQNIQHPNPSSLLVAPKGAQEFLWGWNRDEKLRKFSCVRNKEEFLCSFCSDLRL